MHANSFSANRVISWLGGFVLIAIPGSQTTWAQDKSTQRSSEGPVSRAEDPEEKPQPALGGYCSVSYQLSGKAVKGDAAHRSEFQGELYYFVSSEAKKTFDADPWKYLPQFGGLCTTSLGGSFGNRLPSDPSVFEVRNQKLYLFSSERAKRAYDTRPDWFIKRAEVLFEEPVLGGICPVSYIQRNKAIPGHPVLKYNYKRQLYYFANRSAREAFVKDPQKFLPRYDRYCAEGVSRGKRYPADPTVFIVHEQRTYLFFDVEARIKFLINPYLMTAHADGQWKTLSKQK